MLSLLSTTPPPSVFIDILSTLNGGILDERHEPAHSWVRNFYNLRLAQTLGIFNSGSTWGAGYLSLRSPDGTYRSPNQYDAHYFIAAAINTSVDGILCGRGSDAVSVDDYALQTPITHGTGTNQLSHRAQAAASPSYTSGTKTWSAVLTRLFDNLSGSTITVTECGLFASTYTSAWKLLLCRDILSSSIDVANKGVLSVSYTISAVFPD